MDKIEEKKIEEGHKKLQELFKGFQKNKNVSPNQLVLNRDQLIRLKSALNKINQGDAKK